MSNVQTVQEIYASFGRGEIPAILERLADDVSWDAESTPGVPWLQTRRGRANVAGFFEALAPLDFTRFEPHTCFDGGDRVMALVDFEVTHTPSGKKYLFPDEGHLWEFDGAGKVKRYQHLADTAKHQLMARGA